MPRLEARRICLVRTSALGDVVHALALVNGLRAGYPDAEITWVLHPLGYEVVRNQPGIDRFVVFERRGGVKGWAQLRRELAGERFDICLVPQVSLKASLVSALVKADVKLGFDWARSRELHYLFTNRHIPARPAAHVQDQYFEFLDDLGVHDYPIEWNIAFTEEELAWRESFFASLRRPAVAFVVASSNREKDWPVGRYVRVVQHVDQILGMRPLIVGGPSPRERELAASLAESSRAGVVVALERPVRRTLLQLSGAAVVVSPDTGPLHAAVALGVPTVSLFGTSNPRRCGPYWAFADLLIDHYTDPGEADGPIRRTVKRGRMATITPDEVIARIELALERYPRAGAFAARAGRTAPAAAPQKGTP